MLDDAVLTQGRQTKKKWKTAILLTAAAGLLLGFSWLLSQPQSIESRFLDILARLRPQKNEAWIQTDYKPGTCAFALNDQLFFAESGCLTVMDSDGVVLDRKTIPLNAPQAVTADNAAVLWAPGEDELLLLHDSELTAISVPLGIDAAAVSDTGTSAVITAKTGFETVIRQYDSAGQLLREQGFPKEAAVFLAFPDSSDTLAACVLTQSGAWRLDFIEETSSLEIPLEAAQVYGLKPCGDHVAVLSSSGLSIYNTQGAILSEISFLPEQLLLWDSGSFAAMVLLENGAPRLVTLSPSGRIFRSEPLSQIPQELSVCGGRLCVLDREALLFYDIHCRQTGCTPQGALADGVQAVPGGAVLFGDGEFTKYILK